MTMARRFGRNEGIALAATWVLVVVLLFVLSRSDDAVWLDFSSFYSAAKLVAAGDGERLFDAAAQQNIQQELFLRSNPLLFYHPPFELLPIVPLARLSYRDALLVWGAAQAAVLMMLPVLLAPLVPRPAAPMHLAAVSFAFPPCWIALAQGQDSLLLLLLLTLCARDLAAARDGRAGFWLALAMFKFQFVVPLVVLLLLRRRIRILIGFAPGLALAAAMSAAVCGWKQLLRYPRFLLEMVSVDAHGTIAPTAMMNLRGLLAAAGVVQPLRALMAAGVLGLIVAIGWLWWTGRQPDDPVRLFASAVAASALLSYHLNPHDAAILLIPLLLALSSASIEVARTSLIAASVLAASVIYSPWTFLVLPGLSRLGFAALAVLVLAFTVPVAVRRAA